MIDKNIRELREAKALSQTALADLIGLKRGNISSYEKGLAQPNIQNLIKLSNFFQISIDHLVREDLSEAALQEESFLKKFSHSLVVQTIRESLTSINRSKTDSSLQTIKKRNVEIKKMISGFRSFHDYRMEHFNMKKADIESLSHDYKNLLSLMETLLKANEELIKLAED